MAWLVFSWLLAMVIEWVGVAYWWPELGAQHSERLYAAELRYLQTDLRRSLLVEDPAQFGIALARQMRYYAFDVTRITDLVGREWTSTSDAGARLRAVQQTLAQGVRVAMAVSNTFALRLSVLLLWSPAFVVFGSVALIDGLVQRDVRRASGGRESSFVYHWAKLSMPPLLILSGVIWLAVPFSMRPMVWLVAIIAVFALGVRVRVSSFKKYL